MTAGLTPSEVRKIAGSGALKSAEWMAENAYIAPGFHRLLTAGGLTLGLYGGRKFMDVLTARNATNGEEIPATQTVEIMRPLHGVMRYNPYSDHAADRWKFVVDKMAPVAFGAVGAYFGGKYFANGRLPNKEPLFPTGVATNMALSAKKYSTEITDSAMRMLNGDAIRKWAAATFTEGSTTGQHIFGALWPFNNGMIAVSFQELGQRSIFFPTIIPGARAVNRWLGNNGGSSRGMFSAMRNTASWMSANILSGKSAELWAHDSQLMPRVRDALQMYPAQAKAIEQKLAAEYRLLIKEGAAHVEALRTSNPAMLDGEIQQSLNDFLSGATNPHRGLFGSAHDHLLHNVGADLSNTSLAQGPFQQFGHFFGSRTKQVEVLERHADYLTQEFKNHPGRTYGHIDPKTWAAQQVHMPTWKSVAAYTGGVATIGGALVTASTVATKLHGRSNQAHKPHILDQSSIDKHITPANGEKPKSDSNIVDWVNDKPLNVAHWISRVVIAPPSMHRFMNAAYLSAVLYAGVKGSNLLTGRVLTKLNSNGFVKNKLTGEFLRAIETDVNVAKGDLIPESAYLKEHVWKPLQSLHGKLAYTPGSAELRDRWRQAAHYIAPVALGMFGTWTGSHMYFADRIKSLSKPETLEDYTDKISLEQSKPYAALTALTSIFNTGSGLHLLPVFNYSANLHNRYLMGSGQQVAMPGIGKWWSGNPGTTPWGVKHTLDQLTHYLTYNDGPRPKELRSLIHSVIAKLYPNLDDTELLDKKQVMIDRIHDVRDSYLVEGVVPPSKRAALGEAMHQLFSGAGFEALLQESGLDPAKANLASNGASGAIANFLGSKRDVSKLSEEYRSRFAQRLAVNDTAKPSDFLKSLLDKGPKAADAPAEPKRFTERTKGDSSSYPIMSV